MRIFADIMQSNDFLLIEKKIYHPRINEAQAVDIARDSFVPCRRIIFFLSLFSVFKGVYRE